MNITELSDIQSESGVIGTLIYHPEYILHSDYLRPSYFSGTENGCVYWSIQELYKEGISNIDAYNISNKLQSNRAVQRVIERCNLPSIQEFVDLYKETARHTLEEYKMLTDNIVTLAFKRDLVKTMNKLTAECYNTDFSLDDISNRVYGDLDELTNKFIFGSEIQTVGDQIDQIWENIENRRTGDGLCGLPSVYPLFNRYFTYEKGELIVIQAGYKEGKSTIMMNEVMHKVKNGVPTLVIDTEMSTELYVERVLAHLTGIGVNQIKGGTYSEADERKLAATRQWMKEHKLVHLYVPEIEDEKVYTICKKLQYTMGLQFVVYDYMKSDEASSSDNYNILGAKCNYLKNKIAGELGLAVLAGCQLNRVGEVADSIKINRYLSTGIKVGFKPQEMIAKDGLDCGNYYAKVYVNRLGEHMPSDDEDKYIDMYFDGRTATVTEADQHATRDALY